MSITDELREFSKTTTGFPAIFKELTDIADRIDERHAKDALSEYIQGYNTGFDVASDEVEDADELRERMEREYTKLPVDADGVPWRIGDVTESGQTIKAMGLNKYGWYFLGTVNEIDPSIHRHHHEPTVEDVLREFFSRYVTTKPKDEDDAIIAEYAAKLRLAGEAK